MPRAPFARLVPVAALLAGLIALALLPGCARGTFLGDRYNNFRAYYNTFYNAKKSFEEGEEQLQRPDRRIERDRYLSVFTDRTDAGRPTQGGPFQEAIDKGADLLRERPDSKWADDALLLIGKAYFYQGNYVGAEGKFRETITAADERGQAELGDEARFWLGRTLTASERYDEAATVLQEGLAREGLHRHWRSRMQLALAELSVQQRAWEGAANALAEAIPEVHDGDLGARAQFLLGQVLEASGRYEAAAEAYARVARFKPVYELGYAARLSRALVLGLDVGQPDEALVLIRRMRSDDKNYQNRAEVELAYARLLAAAGQTETARERYWELLYGEEFRGNAFRGPAYYRYGEFHRDNLNDYTRASAYFDSAATSLRTEPGREDLYTRAALVGVRRQADVYRSYATIAQELAEADSLLHLGSLDDAAFRDAIAAIEAERLRAWSEEQRRLGARRASAGFGNVVVEGGGAGDFGAGRGEGETGVEAGFLNYRNPARVQDALIAFQRAWGDRPLVPNWRRRQDIGGALATGEREFGATGPGDEATLSQGGPPPLDLSLVPRTEAERTLLRTERAQLRYELGNVLFLSLAEPDSAAYWYDRVVQEDADEPVALRALYALAEVRRAQERRAEAEPLYRRVIEAAPESDLADVARERLGLPPRVDEAETDDEAEAAAAYEAAYAAWRAEAYPEAFAGLLDVAAHYPESDVAPRALLAAARTFVEWARQDSLDLVADFPAALVPPAFQATAQDSTGGEAEPFEEPFEEPLEEPVEESLEEMKANADGEDDGVEEPVEEEPVREEAVAQRGFAPPSPDTSAVTDFSALSAPPPLPTDSTATVADSTATVADSTATVADTTATVADSLAVPPPPAFGLIDLYALIEAGYPGTPYAEQAAALRSTLVDALAPEEAAPDSVAERPEEGEADADVLGDDQRPGQALPPEVVEAAPEGTFGLSGDLPLSTEIGGYSWRVASLPSPLAARALLRNLERRGLRVGVVLEQSDQGPLYLVLLGQFASTDDAIAARPDLPSTGVGRDVRIVDIASLVLLTDEELDPRGLGAE